MNKLLFAFLIIVCSLLSCQKTSLNEMTESSKTNPVSVEKQASTSVQTASATSVNSPSCSFSGGGTLQSWSSGNFNIPVYTSTDNKFYWKGDGSVTNTYLTKLKVKIVNNANYPVTVRVIAVKTNIWGSDYQWDVYQTCYDINTTGSSKTYDFAVPYHTTVLGNKEGDYSHFDFEVIAYNKTFAGQPTRTSVPVNVTVCRYNTLACF